MAAITPDDFLPADAAQEWKADLLAAQRAWITFKQKDCDAVAYEWYGGTGANFAVGSCLHDHTVQRTKDLRERYQNR
ncbi:lysozyme inhibitor LprI family protein [Bauldia sp.]|uniref:lysozyme inhibitor LprI family protein n=1 Tax=Bauldia sp. TaxID=2575872 RepID=UPI003BACCFC5